MSPSKKEESLFVFLLLYSDNITAAAAAGAAAAAVVFWEPFFIPLECLFQQRGRTKNIPTLWNNRVDSHVKILRADIECRIAHTQSLSIFCREMETFIAFTVTADVARSHGSRRASSSSDRNG
jgi:hypothetical protein